LALSLTGRSIVLGVTGSIAAFKAVSVASELTKRGAIVDVIMTEGATHFVGPLSFQAITHRPVNLEMFSLLSEVDIGHISLGKRADVLVVAPATANEIARLALGIADNLLLTTALATRAPIIVAPAMEPLMYEHPATQANVATLRQRGATILEPAEGRLASGKI
jgi:phosphopantothenoylcysteine decarboxylase / phosphopantothenate---cysteine ligase